MTSFLPSPSAEEPISNEKTEQSSQNAPYRPAEVDKYVDDFLSVVCDTSRRYILEMLADPKGIDEQAMPEKRSGDIARAIGLSAATTSEHLRHLTRAGLVTSRREGNMVYYRLRNYKLVEAFHTLLDSLTSDYNSRVQNN